MLDLFCGRFGWGRAFAARGWEVVGVDLVEPNRAVEVTPAQLEHAINLLVGVCDSAVTDSGHCSICLKDPHSPGCIIELVEKFIPKLDVTEPKLPVPIQPGESSTKYFEGLMEVRGWPLQRDEHGYTESRTRTAKIAFDAGIKFEQRKAAAPTYEGLQRLLNHLADRIEVVCYTDGSEQWKLACSGIAKLLRTGWPFPGLGLLTEAAAPTPTPVSIDIFQQDWTPGFASFHDDGQIAAGAHAHVTLNLGSLLCAVRTGDLDKRDLPYLIAETLMHETVHVLEAWANVEFSEDRVETLLTKYREKYDRATIWEYTGAEPSVTEAQSPTEKKQDAE